MARAGSSKPACQVNRTGNVACRHRRRSAAKDYDTWGEGPMLQRIAETPVRYKFHSNTRRARALPPILSRHRGRAFPSRADRNVRTKRSRRSSVAAGSAVASKRAARPDQHHFTRYAASDVIAESVLAIFALGGRSHNRPISRSNSGGSKGSRPEPG